MGTLSDSRADDHDRLVGAGSVVLGATGLVGRAVAALLAARGGPVVALTRRPVGLPGVTDRVVDFSRPAAAVDGLVGRDLYCCLGTTLRKAGSPEAFRAVDHDLPFALMTAAAERGFARIFLVSSAGADPRSAFLYNRVKGELEAAASALAFEAVHIARPSLLLGARSESRPAEAFAQALAPYLGPLLPARLRPIRAEAVARALLRLADEGASGVHVHESDALTRLAAGPSR
jgi:uncharacterized protein YbjT (DUF2867 family)